MKAWFAAAWDGKHAIMESLLTSKNIDVNALDPKVKEPALLMAVRWGHIDAVRLLLEYDADQTLKNKVSISMTCKVFSQ